MGDKMFGDDNVVCLVGENFGEVDIAKTREWSRSIQDLCGPPARGKTFMGFDFGSWERTVEWIFDSVNPENSRVVNDSGWRRIG